MRILLINDDANFMHSIIPAMSEEYVVDIAMSGDEGTQMSLVNDYDIYLVSDYLQDMSGSEICRSVRQNKSGAPIVVVGKSSNGLVDCLSSGADYVCNFSTDPQLLKAQINAMIRTRHLLSNKEIVRFGPFTANLIDRVVKRGRTELALTRREYDVLIYLILNKGKIISKEELLEHVWNQGIYVFSNTVEVHIKRLRNKLITDSGNPIIKTVRGFGYTATI
ncbi:hypothetical protein A3K34_04040 [candidate division WWE3 bacterium RIFOXYC1_FULL_40_10]|nr:MAG: hypothetical protein A3K58_04040 [candidate division WWE3 bacterium RIFOXYB1_FULL_40_22]OGC62011.1 MAG: hypothetical protein A3K37_04040 [candidate division WWE3 bacterium RIFOXYA1_FULL_40_11]OGC65045.1 MAG: hypothetical protein A2326_03340 [candidate division WWE3 bacterium RIFOXYB2_FULL_41_6]OGC66394.1 MAG: hypothetical protein A3K34_04040 [candidate division WWE3 bacterium RIFOXYC1_FULL_40_10]OGC70298.1 MAG: hypothetical protein A2602_04485 [candidate division WWE3 bacterium RIFOXYD1